MERNRVLNQIGVFFVTCLIVLLSSQIANAANQYILDGATGTYSTTKCDSWASDRACDDLPSSLVRGDTYYIADGNYAYHLFDDAVDGTKVISILKATATMHGTNTGWDNAYGDGQAIFTGNVISSVYSQTINFRQSYYIFDGQVGSGSNAESYGFKIIPADSTHIEDLVGIPAMQHATMKITDVQVSHSAIMCSGIGDGTKGREGIYSNPRVGYETERITISNNYLSGGNTNIVPIRAKTWTIDRNYFADNWSSSAVHGQQIAPRYSSDITLKNNTFAGTTLYVIGAHEGPNTRWLIYNNIMIGGTTINSAFGNANQAQSDNVTQWQVHHNTFIGVSFTNTTAQGMLFPGLLTDVATDKSYAYNNLFYDCENPRLDNSTYTSGAVIHDNNAYLACTTGGGAINSSDESSYQRDDRASNPLNADYKINQTADLANAAHVIKTGKTGLGSTYVLDKAGNTRDALPGIGAYEYETDQSTLLVISANGTVTSRDGLINCGSTCSANYDPETSVTLTAVANSGYTFTSWLGGGCSGTGACTVTMNAATTVTATFATSVYNLTVTKPGTGVGTVTGSDGLINCGSTCSVNYESGKAVTLAASATSGSTFSGWSGGCSGTGACTVNMTAAKSVTATFTPVYNLTVTKSVTGAGAITSSDSTINCGSTCSANYNPGRSVTLTASTNSGYTFTGWSGGGCSGTGNCTVNMTAATSVTATFATSVYNLTVTKPGTGTGTVTGSDGLINCGSTCSVNYESGKSVTLAASANSGSTFSGWSGGCSGTGTCTATMTAAKSVTATFAKSVVYNLTVTKSGTGSGTVTSSPSGISCGSTCSANYTSGTVTLVASANSGSTFSGWSGGCIGTGTCTLNMTTAKSVKATFAKSVSTSKGRR